MPFKTTKSDMIKSDTKLNMTVTTEDRGRQNVWAKEPRMDVMDVAVTHNEKAEKLNGRLAMLGVMAALSSYAMTGQMIPGLW